MKKVDIDTYSLFFEENPYPEGCIRPKYYPDSVQDSMAEANRDLENSPSGNWYYISDCFFRTKLSSDMSKIPIPTCPHKIYKDPETDGIIVKKL